MTAHMRPVAHKEFGPPTRQLSTGFAFAKLHSMSPSATLQLTPAYKIGGPSTMKQQMPQLRATVQDWMCTGIQYAPALPPYLGFARTSFNSAFRRTAEPSFQQTSTQQHDNSRTVFKQHQEHFHSKRGAAEEQDAYNKV